jgi:adenine-specific DNA-methyltransferase
LSVQHVRTTPQTISFSDTESDGSETEMHGVRWERLMRGGGTWYRDKRRNLCYPVLLSGDRTRMIRCGQPLQGDDETARPDEIDGHPVAWPVRSDGRLGVWRVEGRKLDALIAKGYAQVTSKPNAVQPTLRYLLGGTVERIETGEIAVVAHGDRGEVIVEFPERVRTQRAKTVWRRGRHTAGGAGGAQLLNDLLGARGRFPFPKSLYAVEDTLRVAVGGKPDALVLDFFSGSGTTAHAAMRLNRQDGGDRRSISITNNEVSADEQRGLRDDDLRPGDVEWEEYGICEFVTKPRISAAVTGKTPGGEPINGDYKFVDESPMADGFAENVEFFTLTYEAPLRVASNRDFEKIAPLLWMRAGSRGRRIEDISAGWDVADTYGVLADLDHTGDFVKAVVANDEVSIAYVVTDESRLFEAVAQELPDHVEPVRLYEAYLRNFEIESGRGAL